MAEEQQTSAQNNTQAEDVSQTPAPEVKAAVDAQPAVGESTQSAKPATETDNTDSAEPQEITYEVKLPDGSLLTPEKVQEVVAYAKENNLSNEQAQALLDRESNAVKSWQESQVSAFEETKAKWVDTVMNDKEIGGVDFNKNIEYAHRALEKFASPELKDALAKTGFGNHPELVRVFTRIGKAMADDTLIRTGMDRPTQKRSMEDIFYGAKN